MASQDKVAWSARLRDLAARFGDRVAVRGPDSALTYRELSDRAHGLARRLRELGVAQGDSVAFSLPNCVESVWASYGIGLHGAAETPMHHALTAEEVSWFGGLAGTKWVIARENRREFFASLGMEVIAVEGIGSDAKNLQPPVPGQVRGRILATSGTTGKPKAIVYSHAALLRGRDLLKAALPFEPRPGERILLMTPFPHGASLMTWAWLDFGGEVLLHEGVERARVLAALREGVVAVFAPPTVINKLSELFPEEHFPGVRCVFTGTQTLTAATYHRAERLFGPVVRVTYGKTECTNPITVLQAAETATYFATEARGDGACLGTPASGVELQVRGEPGEIWLRARHMADGYIDRDGFHAFEDGWHATGDLGWMDERGRLWLSGRLADVIKTGGYKVQPDEIESLLAGLPSCGQVVVTSLPSDYWGEIIVAAAENAAGSWMEEGRLRVAGLSRHKHPRAWVALESLPRNAQGKVNRRDVRKTIEERYRLEDGPRPALRPR